MAEKEETPQKKVDESWKEDIKKEKVEEKEERALPEGDFHNFITGLVMQCLMFMGEVPDPVTREKRKDIFQAKYIIDILMMLRDKTKGNLSEEEGGLLEAAIHELQMKYLKAAQAV